MLFFVIKAYSRKMGHTCGITKTGQGIIHLWIFNPFFFKFGAFRMLHPPKRHVFLEFLVVKKIFHF